MRLKINAVGFLFALAVCSQAAAQTADKRVLNLDGAKNVIAAAVAEAKKLNAAGAAIAVVDDGGNLMAVERLDNTFAAGANISIGKARTAALFKRPTKALEDIINQGRTAMTSLNDFTPLQGGVPILVDGQIVGAVGVSGAASAEQDEDIANAGVIAFDAAKNAPQLAVSYLPAKQVSQVYAEGMNLVKSQNYKVDASHRDAPGVVEVHTKDTDIIYVLEGTATLVTGGRLIDGKTIEPDEISGSDTDGGEARIIAKGDVIVIPNGTPHWFKKVNGSVNYYVVKVRAAD